MMCLAAYKVVRLSHFYTESKKASYQKVRASLKELLKK